MPLNTLANSRQKQPRRPVLRSLSEEWKAFHLTADYRLLAYYILSATTVIFCKNKGLNKLHIEKKRTLAPLRDVNANRNKLESSV